MSADDVSSSDGKHNKDGFYKEKLEELEKENQQLKLMRDSLQNHLNMLMKKIRNVKLAKSEDLIDAVNVETGGIRFSITDSNGLSSRCYTTLFDSLEDLSINQGNDDFRISALDQSSSDSSDSYVELNAYSPYNHPEDPPRVHLHRKPISDVNTTSRIFSFNHLENFSDLKFIPEDIDGNILSQEMIIKSPRRPTRANKLRTKVIDSGSNFQSTSLNFVGNIFEPESIHPINISDGRQHLNQITIMDTFLSYHSAMDREELRLCSRPDCHENPWSHTLNPISELIQYLPFYTCVRDIPRLAKLTACKVSQTTTLPSGSSSSFEIAESTLNPFNVNSKVGILSSPLDLEDPPVIENKNIDIDNDCDSNLSVEYCLPPEEGSIQSEIRCPETANHFKVTLSQPAPISREKQILKRGILRKLNKKFKLWSNYFCILTNKGLFFYNIKYQPQPEDFFFVQKPVKGISVEMMTKIDLIRSEKVQPDFHLGSFEVWVTNGKRYTLATGDSDNCREWLRSLTNVIRQHQATIVMETSSNQMLHKGWVTRVKWGCTRRLWCCLAGKYLIYFKNNGDYFPTGYRDLSNTVIEINSSCVPLNADNIGSDVSDSLDYPDHFFTVSIASDHRSTIFLRVDSELQMRTWSHYLRISARTDDPDLGRPVNFNDVIRSEYQDRFYYWRGEIHQPVSVDTSDDLRTGAIQLWKALERYSSVEHHSTRKDHLKDKYDRISFLVRLCTEEPGLKDELYLQLMKQTQSRLARDSRPGQPRKSKFSLLCGGEQLASSSTSSSNVNESTTHNAILSMWQCLAIVIPVMLPSPTVLALLRKYLHLSKDIVDDDCDHQVFKYASYCLEQLNHVKEVSARLRPPSLFEVTAISARNPYTHSLPFSLPVYTERDSYQVISFSPLSSIRHMHDSLLQAIFSPESINALNQICQFSIYLYQPLEVVKYIFLNPHSNICDVISKYEDQVNTKKMESTIDECLAGIRFFLRVQSFKYSVFTDCYQNNPLQCLDLMRMLCHQIHSDVIIGHYSLSGSQLLVLVSLLCDAHQAESHQDSTLLHRLIAHLIPSSLLRCPHSNQHISSLVVTRLNTPLTSTDQNIAGIYDQYLRYIRDLCQCQWAPTSTICVAASNSDLFPGQQLIVVCQESSINFLDYKCRICLKKIPLSDILSFGSSAHHFLIAYSLMPMRKSFKRIILYLPDHCSTLDLISTIVFYVTNPKSQDS